MFNKILIILMLSPLITSCGHPKFDIVKPPTAEENSRALVTVYRDGKRPGTRHWIRLDGHYIAGLNEKEYIQFYVTSGTHEIGTICTLPTYHFDRFMKPYDPSTFYYGEPYLSNGDSLCYMSTEYESVLGNNCTGMKLVGQKNSVCNQKSKQLTLVSPEPNQLQKENSESEK